MTRQSLSFILLAAVLALGSAACSASAEQGEATAEEDVVASGIALHPVASPPDLVSALTAAADASGAMLEVATFRYETASAPDPRRVVTAVRAKLPHAKLRVDEGAIDDAVLRATLDEYGVSEATQQDAIATALGNAVGARPTTRKLWLRSDDVPHSETEWAEVSLIFITPKERRATLITVRYEN